MLTPQTLAVISNLLAAVTATSAAAQAGGIQNLYLHTLGMGEALNVNSSDSAAKKWVTYAHDYLKVVGAPDTTTSTGVPQGLSPVTDVANDIGAGGNGQTALPPVPGSDWLNDAEKVGEFLAVVAALSFGGYLIYRAVK